MKWKFLFILVLTILSLSLICIANDAAILEQPELDPEYGVGPDGLTITVVLVILVLFVIIISLILKNYRIKKKIMTDFTDLDNVLKEIKSHHGRVTERHLRQVFGYSRTQLRIILRFLENEDKIRRYKENKKKVVVLKEN